ncbi:MAG TPA: hypothetical protein DDW52_24095 [Planctomycetaceae bacterium]|nr:hypothetical protein [Planctomycetaceae bacterium]
MLVELTRSELLDWLALWQVDPWGPDRADRRAAVQAGWFRGVSFQAVSMEYPYVGGDDGEEELLDLLDQDRKDRDNAGEASTPEPEDNG